MSLPPDLHNDDATPSGVYPRSFVIFFLSWGSFFILYFHGWAVGVVVVVVIVARLMCFVLVSLSLLGSVRRLPSWQ